MAKFYLMNMGHIYLETDQCFIGSLNVSFFSIPYETHREKTGFLHMRTQRSLSAPLLSLHR